MLVTSEDRAGSVTKSEAQRHIFTPGTLGYRFACYGWLQHLRASSLLLASPQLAANSFELESDQMAFAIGCGDFPVVNSHGNKGRGAGAGELHIWKSSADWMVLGLNCMKGAAKAVLPSSCWGEGVSPAPMLLQPEAVLQNHWKLWWMRWKEARRVLPDVWCRNRGPQKGNTMLCLAAHWS